MRTFVPPIRETAMPRPVQLAGRAATIVPAGSLPEPLRAGAEALGGFSLADVKVHRDSPEPAKLGALAFARGSDIHLGPGQERHLPHETWHVVQQKQGRVGRAFPPGSGEPINEDPSLEAEADQMGRAASEVRGFAAATVRDGPIQDTAIQLQVSHNGAPLAKQKGDSDTVKSYIDAPEEYFMRDDSDRTDRHVHLLEKKIYVLGESHDDEKKKTVGFADRRWNRQTSEWTDVPRMIEEDVPGLQAPEKLDIRATHSFDSLPARFLIEAIKVSKTLLVLQKLGQKENWQTSNDFIDHLEAVGFWFNEWHPDAFSRIASDPAFVAGDASTATLKREAALKFIELYSKCLDDLRFALRSLALKLNVQSTADMKSADNKASTAPEAAGSLGPAKGKASTTPKAAGYYLGKVKEKGSFFSKMIADLAALLTSASPERAAVAGVLEAPTFDIEEVQAKAVKATLGIRDRAMLYNLEMGPRPVLVKTGAEHAKTIKNWFGEEAVNVPRFMPFSWVTRRSKPLEGWTEKK